MSNIFIKKVILSVIFVTSQHLASGLHDCNRTLLGSKGTISSYNFPLDYANDLDCTYTHYFAEFGDDLREICFQFTRFDTICPNDNLAIGNETLCGRGDNSLVNLCFPLWGDPFVIRFQTDSSEVRSGFYAEYRVTTYFETTTAVPTTTQEVTTGFNETTDGNVTEPGPTGPMFCSEPDMWTCFTGERCVTNEQKCGQTRLCADGSERTYAHARCPGTLGQTSLARACDFSFGQAQNASNGIFLSDCLFEGDKDLGRWVLDIKSEDEEYGPRSVHNYVFDDHFEDYSRYVRSNFFSTDSDEIRLQMRLFYEMFAFEQPFCLTFWYHMFGKDVGRLDVLWDSINIGAMWSRTGNLEDRWYKGQIQRVPLKDSTVIWFVATRGSDKRAQIAIDDVSLMPGRCYPNNYYELEDDISCTFERDMCGWTPTSAWFLEALKYPPGTSGPPGAAQGLYYLGQVDVNEPVNIISPMVASIIEHRCFIFQAFSGNQNNPVTVVLEHPDGTYTNLDDQSFSQEDQWQRFKIDINTQKPFRVILGSKSGKMFFDDFAFVENSCDQLDFAACTSEQFRCDDLSCIDSSKVCDGRKDCSAGEDERNCEGGGIPRGVAIFLIVLICLIVVAAAVGGFVFWKKRKTKQNTANTGGSTLIRKNIPPRPGDDQTAMARDPNPVYMNESFDPTGYDYID